MGRNTIFVGDKPELVNEVRPKWRFGVTSSIKMAGGTVRNRAWQGEIIAIELNRSTRYAGSTVDH
jgi:hypothetical protein